MMPPAQSFSLRKHSAQMLGFQKKRTISLSPSPSLFLSVVFCCSAVATFTSHDPRSSIAYTAYGYYEWCVVLLRFRFFFHIFFCLEIELYMYIVHMTLPSPPPPSWLVPAMSSFMLAFWLTKSHFFYIFFNKKKRTKAFEDNLTFIVVYVRAHA